MLLAVAQSTVHLYRDYDLVLLAPNAIETPKPAETQNSKSTISQLKGIAGTVAQRSITLVISTAIAGPFIYFTFLRSLAWSLALKVGRSMFTLSKQVKPSGLTDITTLMFRFAWSGLLLALIWEASNQAFTIYTAQEPLKKGQPLTTDSKDPNGSLIAGLKAKKEIPKTVAFWELNTITDKFPERRATLYGDMDRRGGSTWSQISSICLAEVQSVSQRIQDCLQPVAGEQKTPEQAQALPKISQPLKNDNIFNASPPATTALQLVQGGVSTIAKGYGSSPSSGQVAPKAQKLLEYGSNNLLGEQRKQQISRSNLSNQANGYVSQLLRSPIGVPFRRSFSRQANAVIFGVPLSDASRIINAVQSICSLVVFSLKEDKIGLVQKDIATIVRTLVSTIQGTQNFLQTLSPHWTDVDFNGDRQTKEVEALLTVMKTGLGLILMTFGEYAPQLGLNRTEVRVAREIAGDGPEMEMRAK